MGNTVLTEQDIIDVCMGDVELIKFFTSQASAPAGATASGVEIRVDAIAHRLSRATEARVIAKLAVEKVEAVAEVLWFDPTAEGNAFIGQKPAKIIDASLAFFDQAKIGDKLYTLPQRAAARVQEREAVRQELLNTPELHNFSEGVTLEALHQRSRGGSEHDAGKMAADWFWLVGYLAGKALHAQTAGNTEKALHHTISTAAALANWHASITGAHTAMRPGIEPPTHHARTQEGL